MIARQIREAKETFPLDPDFGNTVSAVWHYYKLWPSENKEEVEPFKDLMKSQGRVGIMGVEQYYELINRSQTKIRILHAYENFKNPEHRLKVVKHRAKFVTRPNTASKGFLRRVITVLKDTKSTNSQPKLATCYIDNDSYDN